jgi:hypothetical protein
LCRHGTIARFAFSLHNKRAEPRGRCHCSEDLTRNTSKRRRYKKLAFNSDFVICTQLVDIDVVIYPGVGIARVGNSDISFVGPTKPHTPVFPGEKGEFREKGAFRDKAGRIKKQAAKFALYRRKNNKWEKLSVKKVESIEVRKEFF